MSKRYSYCQGTLDVGDAPPPSLLEDDEIDLKDLATVPYVERATPDQLERFGTQYRYEHRTRD